MKRIRTPWPLMILTGLFLVGSFAACSDDNNDTGTNVVPATIPASLQGTWAASSVTVGGEMQPVASFFDWSPGTTELLVTIDAGGTLSSEERDYVGAVVYYDSGPAEVVGTTLSVRIDSQNGAVVPEETTFEGTWAVEGALLTLQTTDPESGQVVEIIFTNDLGFPAECVQSWYAESVSVDGGDVPLADFFEWNAGSVSQVLAITSAGSFHSAERDAAGQEVYYGDGVVTATGTHFVVTSTSENGSQVAPHADFDGQWKIVSGQLQLTMIDPDSGSLVDWSGVARCKSSKVNRGLRVLPGLWLPVPTIYSVRR